MKLPIFLTLNFLTAIALAQSPSVSPDSLLAYKISQSKPNDFLVRAKDWRATNLKIDPKDSKIPMVIDKSALQKSLQQTMGPGEGGGGDAQRSTREDLQEIVSSMDRHIWEISDRYLVGRTIELTSRPLKGSLSGITSTILGLRYFTINDSIKDYVKSLKFEIIDGPCLDGQEARDASTLYQKNAPICLSAPRLSRFPKSALKQVLLPLIFHEVAHQFGYGEADAKAFQNLAALHLKYRTIYLSSVRARFECAFASNMLTEAEKQDTLAAMAKVWGQFYPNWPSFSNSAKTSALLSCAVRATSTGENLERIYDGDLWAPQIASALSGQEKQVLMDYNGQNSFSFLTMIKALSEPAIVSDCRICQKDKVDPALIMMLGAKAAMEHIDREVGRLQDLIQL